jgi:predicted nucleotidyltransferase
MDTALIVPTIDKRQRIPMEVIHSLAKRIAMEFHPLKIILFGSYAYGTPRPESDVDLLVIMDTPLKESEQSLKIRLYINILFGMDLLVYTPQHLFQRLDWGDPFMKEIVEKGVVLYEASNA